MMSGLSRTLGGRAAAAVIKSSRGNPQAMMAMDGPRRCYHDAVIEHYENPRNVGSLDKSDDDVGTVCVLFGFEACFVWARAQEILLSDNRASWELLRAAM